MENNKLQVILKEQNISESDVKKLAQAFGAPFNEAGEVLATYKDIKVTDEADKEGMQKARESRLILKKARTTIENSRKELKADIVKQGRAIDSVARLVKEEIEPAEEYLELQEKYAEIQAEKRAEEQAKKDAELKAERTRKLMAYTDDISFYNLDEMNEEQFNKLLNTLKAQKEQEEAEAKKLEEERLAKVKAEAEENERIRVENEKLKKEREEAEAEQAKKDAEAKAEQDRIQAEADAKVEAERKKAQALEQEKKEREQAEKRARDEAEAKEKQAQLAPDKDKLKTFVKELNEFRNTKTPTLIASQAQDIITRADSRLDDVIAYINSKIDEL